MACLVFYGLKVCCVNLQFFRFHSLMSCAVLVLLFLIKHVDMQHTYRENVTRDTFCNVFIMYLGLASLNQLQQLQPFNTTKYMVCICSNQKWLLPGNVMRQRAGRLTQALNKMRVQKLKPSLLIKSRLCYYKYPLQDWN